jgi:hypothetical protein
MVQVLAMAWCLSGVALASPPAQVEAPAEAPRTVDGADDVAGAQGVRATVLGVLKRHTPPGVEGATEGTAIVLADGTAVFVAKGPPPDGWAWMIGSKVRVQGQLWSDGSAKGGWAVPWLVEPGPPMPGDMGMPGL